MGHVGIDLGGTKIFGVVAERDADGRLQVSRDEKRPTPQGSVDAVVDGIVAVVEDLDTSPATVGIGTPGVVEPGTGTVLRAPNLPGFDRPVPLGDLVAERLGVPVAVGNDVNVAALGEVSGGAAAGCSDVLAVWLGTGVGAGLILDGKLRVGPSGLAGELGHAVVVPSGRRCPCGGQGHLEAYLGRRAMEERARELHASGRKTALVDLAGEGRMKSKAFRRALDEGDEVAVELIGEGLAMLGLAVANVAVIVDIEVVVVGGGLGERFGDIVGERLTEALEDLRFAGTAPRVVESALGDRAGAWGAAALAADEAL